MADYYQPPEIVSDNLFLNDTAAAPQCSICLEDVIDNDGRSIAKLICGHLFHLDCIGSEFNVRGSMCCPNCREIEYGNWLFPQGEGAHEEYEEEVSDEEEEEEEELQPLPGEQPVELRFCPPVEVETQVARDISENRGTITSFPPRIFVLMGCAEHCPSSSQGCTRTCSSAPLMPIHLQCQQPVMNVIVNTPTTIVINRNNIYSGNGNGNGPAAAAANGGLIPLPIFQQLQQPMAQNRFPLSPLSIRRRAGDVAGTSHEQAAPPPRNGSAPQPNEQASIYPESNLELSLEANSTYNEEHPFLCQRLESLNLERLHPIDEASEDEEEEDKIRYPNLIHFF